MMHPYRPLFVMHETDERAPQPLRGLAVLLVVLGMLRLVPALARGERASAELVCAVAMLAIGIGILVRAPLVWRRLRARIWR